MRVFARSALFRLGRLGFLCVGPSAIKGVLLVWENCDVFELFVFCLPVGVVFLAFDVVMFANEVCARVDCAWGFCSKS